MTRVERAAAKVERDAAKLADSRRALAQAEARDREAARVARAKRRHLVGTLADDAGLLAWDDATLAGLFHLVARLQELRDPVDVLDMLLSTWQHAGEVVSPTAAAAGSFLLASAAASDASEVSGHGKGGRSVVLESRAAR